MIAYRREIDGLRALAVVPVILFHAGFKAFSGGFVGVDIFFVISGYLITSIILAEKKTATFTLLGFYERRARRILPALFLVMAACVPVAWLMLLPDDMKDFSQSLTAVSVFASNLLFWHKSGYFDSAAELRPLLHTWSLAVEEQYYVLFPVFLLSLWRFGKPRILIVFTALAMLSLALASWLVEREPSAAFYLLPTRAWELLLGAVIAFYLIERAPRNDGRRINQLAGLTGLLLILVAVVAFDQSTPFPGLYALVPASGTALIILFATPATLAGSLLASRLFVGVGLISYSAYLWHQPLFAFVRHGSLKPPSMSLMLFLAMLSICLAYVSWRFVERPFRRKGTISRTRLFAFAATGSALFASVGLAGHLTNGFEGHYLAGLDARQRSILTRPSDKIQDNGDCHFHTFDISKGMQTRFAACQRKYGRAIVVLGDSHAVNMYEAISINSDYPFVVGVSSGGCRAHSPSAACPYQRFLNFVASRPEAIKQVLYTQAGFYLIQDVHGMNGSRDFFKTATVPVYQPNPLFIDRVVAYLNELSQYVGVVWIGPRVEPHLNVSMLKRYAIGCETMDVAVDPNIVSTFEQLDRALKVRLAREARIGYISQVDAVSFNAATDLYDCNSVFWADTDHWSLAGEQRFGLRMIRALGHTTAMPKSMFASPGDQKARNPKS